MKATITPSRLRELLDYDARTGVFRWRVDTPRRRAGTVAGSVGADGYIIIGVDRHQYRAHRLAWLWEHARWPHPDVDHRNCVRSDNRLVNLREATAAVNAQNRRTPNLGNTSGRLGVSWAAHAKRWKAQILVGETKVHLGYFADKLDAEAAYRDAKAILHEGNTLTAPSHLDELNRGMIKMCMVGPVV